MHEQKLQVVILVGPPGAGKGTQAELLSARLNSHYIESSKILEAAYRNPKEGEFVEADGKKYFLADEKKRWETGLLNSFPFVTELMMEEIKKTHQQGKSLLMAGSPRSVYEGEKETPLLESLYGKENVHVIVIKLSEEQTLFRNSHRKICELMRHPILFSKETENLTLCPLDGSPLNKREGLDDPESIKVRLREYQEHTFPLVEFFEKRGLNVNHINGDQSVAAVFDSMLEQLQK